MSELDEFVEWAAEEGGGWTRLARWGEDVVLTDDGVSLNDDGPDFETMPLLHMVRVFREERS